MDSRKVTRGWWLRGWRPCGATLDTVCRGNGIRLDRMIGYVLALTPIRIPPSDFEGICVGYGWGLRECLPTEVRDSRTTGRVLVRLALDPVGLPSLWERSSGRASSLVGSSRGASAQFPSLRVERPCDDEAGLEQGEDDREREPEHGRDVQEHEKELERFHARSPPDASGTGVPAVRIVDRGPYPMPRTDAPVRSSSGSLRRQVSRPDLVDGPLSVRRASARAAERTSVPTVEEVLGSRIGRHRSRSIITRTLDAYMTVTSAC